MNLHDLFPKPDTQIGNIWLDSKRLSTVQKIQLLVAVLAGIVCMFLTIVGIPSLTLNTANTPSTSYVLGAATLVALAVAFFAVRVKLRVLYGVLEFFCAAGLGAKVMADHAGWGFTPVMGFVAAIYVAVRGIDNVQVGIKQMADKQDAQNQQVLFEALQEVVGTPTSKQRDKPTP
jgi:hypothetical protein